MQCMWCESKQAKNTTVTSYWELPDGTRAIEIKMIPSVHCVDCGMEYQEETLIEEIEDQLMLIDTKPLPNSMTYQELMDVPRFLKKNYFKL
ncbi:YokU family protein [Pseudalkalibacillus berkeleyi]|uniref:YokU family protein n=1 Tax=Pseudalkalibacillus berkeleyi TaxID=1069813 RepID=A0ABS9H099_9BACL|nr:YokU family protein [Pseudalkalibacillus berkeleyi]MCF6137268.1 YokU family protein [Pseudalkalibacillus berkeleyi]